ncbi:MAG: hypothetical protein EKK59_04480 [Neisseriaceae bacterium]|nr:MAG: hypothetical protein EKK59_04480 [Neisseriaceae bacterium]
MSDTDEKPARKAMSLEEVEQIYHSILASPEAITGNESDIVRNFMVCHLGGKYEDRIPCGPADTIVQEMAFKYGRADIVVFHLDGSASVIEVKDGGKGYTPTVAGIGQVGLYATQLGLAKSGLTKIRRCLLWSSTGDSVLDSIIELICEQAGVIPLPHPSIRKIMAVNMAVYTCFAARDAEEQAEHQEAQA